MPRKYTPEVKYKWHLYEPEPDITAEMVESKQGEWVPLKVFEDEQSRLQHEIRRLNNQIRRLVNADNSK